MYIRSTVCTLRPVSHTLIVLQGDEVHCLHTLHQHLGGRKHLAYDRNHADQESEEDRAHFCEFTKDKNYIWQVFLPQPSLGWQ